MKVLILGVFLLGTSSAITFKEYKNLFNKTYDGLEHSQREAYFIFQTSLITNHQSAFKVGRESYNVDHNQITDTGFNDLYRRSFEALPSFMDLPEGKEVVIYREQIPESFYLEVPPTDIFDQTKNGNWTLMGDCNWGWAFAASKAVEIFSYNNLKNRYSIALSPQQFIDCLPCEICKKGLPHTAFQYMAENQQTLYPENSYHYTGTKSNCVPKVQYYPESSTLKSFSTLPEMSTEEDVKSVLYNLKTPIVFEINPLFEGFMNYKSGIYTNPSVTAFIGTHFMVIVGYGREENKTFWKALNSFGKTWGEDGYMKVDMNIPLKKIVFPVQA